VGIKLTDMNWYKTLDIHTRINAKDCFKLLCGADWQLIGRILDMRTRLDLMYEKLKREGFDID
jgi:hypothetical protein